VGQGQEDGVELARVGQAGVDAMAGLRQVSERVADRQPVAVARRQADDPNAWVSLKEPDELRADVTGRTEDRDPLPIVLAAGRRGAQSR
jgi:hypothetical protein